MAARSPNYILILIMVVFTTVVAAWAREVPSKVMYQPDLKAIPYRLGEWNGQDMPLSKEVMDTLNVDAVLNRTYSDSHYGTLAGLLVEYRKYGRRDFIHRPEECFPNAGYEIVDTGTIKVPFGGKEIDATKVIAQKESEGQLSRTILVYWYASGTETQHDYLKQQWSMALDRFRTRKYGWTFVRISCSVTSSDDETVDNIRAFAGLISDPLVKCLTADNAKK